MAERATQVVVEVLEAGNPNARATQVVTEVLRDAPSKARATQLVVEVEARGSPNARATQLALLILAPNYTVPLPLIYPKLPGLAFSVIKTPEMPIGVDQSSSLREVRVAYASTPIWELELIYNFLRDRASYTELKTLLGFYLATNTSLTGFLFKDPDDNVVTSQLLLNQVTGTNSTDGSTNVFLFQRDYGVRESGFYGTEPVGQVDTLQQVNVYLDGTLQDPSTYNVLTTPTVSNVCQFANTPAAGHVVTADFSYYFYVRFKDEKLGWEKFMDKLWKNKKVTLRTLRPLS